MSMKEQMAAQFLKSLGFDPEALKNQIAAFATAAQNSERELLAAKTGFGLALEEVRASFKVIHDNQRVIMEMLVQIGADKEAAVIIVGKEIANDGTGQRRN